MSESNLKPTEFVFQRAVIVFCRIFLVGAMSTSGTPGSLFDDISPFIFGPGNQLGQHSPALNCFGSGPQILTIMDGLGHYFYIPQALQLKWAIIVNDDPQLVISVFFF